MGEQSLPPNQNGFNGKNDESAMDEDIESGEEEQQQEEEDISAEGKFLNSGFAATVPMTNGCFADFQTLNSQLDALNSVLDRIEQKNDSIHSELLVLLQSNRDIRLQLQSEAAVEENENSKQ